MRRLLLITLIVSWGVTAFAGGVTRITLLNGKQMRAAGEIIIEDNMLCFTDTDGQKYKMSKRIVDWPNTRNHAFNLYALAYPEKAAAFKARAKPAEKKIVISNDTLAKMDKNTGLTNKWNSADPVPSAADREAAKAYVEQAKAKVLKRPVIQTIGRANRMDIRRHLDKDRFTIVGFSAKWCGPCRKLKPKLEAFIKKHPESVVLKFVDIKDFNSPVAQQYEIKTIPHVKIYDEDGDSWFEGGGFKGLSKLEKQAKRADW